MSEYFEIHSAEYEEAMEILYGGRTRRSNPPSLKKLKKVVDKIRKV